VVGDGTVRKSVGEFLRALHGTFSSIFTRFRDIAAEILPLLCSSTPLFPTQPLISPVIRWMAFGLRRAKMLG